MEKPKLEKAKFEFHQEGTKQQIIGTFKTHYEKRKTIFKQIKRVFYIQRN